MHSAGRARGESPSDCRPGCRTRAPPDHDAVPAASARDTSPASHAARARRGTGGGVGNGRRSLGTARHGSCVPVFLSWFAPYLRAVRRMAVVYVSDGHLPAWALRSASPDVSMKATCSRALLRRRKRDSLSSVENDDTLCGPADGL